MPSTVSRMLQRRRRTRAVRRPKRWKAAGESMQITAIIEQTVATPKIPRPIRSSSGNRVANGAVTRNATSTWAPGSTTRSSWSNP